MTFLSSVCHPDFSPLYIFVAPVRSSCCVKQAVNQPDPHKTTLLRHQQVSKSTAVTLFCSLPCFTSPSLDCWLLQGGPGVRALTFTGPKPPETQICFLLLDRSLLTAIVRMCQETGWLYCDSVLYVQPLCLVLSKATDTPEDRNNPVLLYNKMELGDLNANFTLELESKVKIN